jgi:hypothetical protein
MFLAWKKTQAFEASMLRAVASLVALPAPTLQIASATASTPI